MFSANTVQTCLIERFLNSKYSGLFQFLVIAIYKPQYKLSIVRLELYIYHQVDFIVQSTYVSLTSLYLEIFYFTGLRTCLNYHSHDLVDLYTCVQCSYGGHGIIPWFLIDSCCIHNFILSSRVFNTVQKSPVEAKILFFVCLITVSLLSQERCYPSQWYASWTPFLVVNPTL